LKDKNFIVSSVIIFFGFSYLQLFKPDLYIDERGLLLFLILLFGGILQYSTRHAIRGGDIFLRTIPGVKAVEEAVGRSTEMGKPVLYVPGIQDMDQVETVAGVVILGHVSKMTARYETPLNVPVARSIVLKAAQEACKESYLIEGKSDIYNENMVHYLTDDQFAYAAGVNGIMNREKPAACLYMGKFYAESLLLAETGNSIGAIQIAGTASQSQIPFFVTACDYTLIGEEFFAASAYLSQKPELLGIVKGQDYIKLCIIIMIIGGVLLRFFYDINLINFNVLDFLTVSNLK
tara:strand:+ start:386 stop:1258 length:873 start_codon:yes stop_codon:yes gene_type:complete